MKSLKIAALAAVVAGIAGVAHAEDLVFTLTNGTNSVLNNFHASPEALTTGKKTFSVRARSARASR